MTLQIQQDGMIVSSLTARHSGILRSVFGAVVLNVVYRQVVHRQTTGTPSTKPSDNFGAHRASVVTVREQPVILTGTAAKSESQNTPRTFAPLMLAKRPSCLTIAKCTIINAACQECGRAVKRRQHVGTGMGMR
jgi:hypothetical protein